MGGWEGSAGEKGIDLEGKERVGEEKNGQNKTRERGTFTGSVCVKGEFFRNC